MKKIAFVVEGQTEQIFVLTFLQHLSSEKQYHIDLKKYNSNQIINISTRGYPQEESTHYILIINVQNDELVLSYISDNLETLKSKGFSSVYGLRDRYTGDKNKALINPDKVDLITSNLSQKYDLFVEMTIAIQEIEAWFLLTPAFFLKYDNSLNENAINLQLGFDLASVDVENLEHPSALINKVLKSVGLEYKKKMHDACKIAANLDYLALYLEKSEKVIALKRFINHLDSALA